MDNITATVICDSINSNNERITTLICTYPRIIHAEILTHRALSRNAASCLSGDTRVTIEKPADLKKGLKSNHLTITIKELVDKWFDGDSKGRPLQTRLKEMHLRSVNEATGEFITSHITNCFRQGIQDIYEITLKNGYKIKCTENHRLFTNKGWKTLKHLNFKNLNGELSYDKPDFKLATNGFNLTVEWVQEQMQLKKKLKDICQEYSLDYKSTASFCEKNKLYFRKKILSNETYEFKNKEWLEQKIKEGLFATEIALICNTTNDKVKKQITKFGLKGNRYIWNSRKEVWNKGKNYKQKEESLVNVRAAAEKRRKKNSYLNYDTFKTKVTRFNKETKADLIKKYNNQCQLTGATEKLDTHHIAPLWFKPELAFDFDNLILVSKSAHMFIHSNNLDLDFYEYYHSGKDLTKFIDEYKGVKKHSNEINKPCSKGNKLVLRYFDIESIVYKGQEETYDLEVSGDYHNFVANGVIVHNSRAIPHAKMIENLKANPFIPEKWMKAHKGMQGSKYFPKEETNGLRNIWLEGRNEALGTSVYLEKLGVTKQLTNRLLEPFQMYTSLITATEWENFLYLRTSEHAEIHLQELADKVLIALNNSDPVSLLRGEWHLPFSDKMEGLNNEEKIKVSVARCARVSYLTHDGEHSIEKDIAMHDKLTKDGHWSPTEHQAYSEPGSTSGNFRGWKQYRKSFNNEKASFSGLVKKVFNGNNMR